MGKAMALTSVRISGASSLYTSELTGTNLGATEADTLKEKTDQALALAMSIREAIAAARSSGAVSFRPNDERLVLPEGLTDTLRDELFADRIGRNFGGGALSLQQWAEAANALEAWAGKARSTLPPALGGGIQFVNGLWYVNGGSLTLSEVYLANRVNIYSQMDNLLTQSLNSIAANNDLVRTLSGGLAHLSEKIQKWVSSLAGDNAATSSVRHGMAYLIGDTVINGTSTETDLVTQPWPKEWHTFVKWAKANNPDGITAKFRDQEPLTLSPVFDDFSLNRADAILFRDELQSFIDSKSADNQVAQMRTESVFTQRANVLEGLGSFMKSQQNSASSAARNLAGG
jgi:hypothetical protein